MTDRLRVLLADDHAPTREAVREALEAHNCDVVADVAAATAAVEAATKAYRLAWCDGPPFAYHWGLEKARRHLRELGASEPEMPAFDESKFEPMPEVEIDPADEFGEKNEGEGRGEG